MTRAEEQCTAPETLIQPLLKSNLN